MVRVSDNSGEQRLREAVTALRTLLHEELNTCLNVSSGFGAIQRAKLEEKFAVLQSHLNSLAACLSTFVEQAFEAHPNLAVANLSSEDAIGWSEEQLRAFLEPFLGHKLEPKSNVIMAGESIEGWLAGYEKPNSSLVRVIADIVAGEGYDLLYPYDEDGNLTDIRDEIDEQRVDEWRAPAWVRLQATCDLAHRLDPEATQVEVAMIQAALWRKLEQAFDRARLRATVYLAGRPEPDVKTNKYRDFEAITPDFRAVRLGDERFDLTPQQAEIVRILFKALTSHESTCLDQSYIMDQIGSPNTRMRHAFRSCKRWRQLIDMPRRGCFRLKVSPGSPE